MTTTLPDVSRSTPRNAALRPMVRRRASLAAQGETHVWLTSGALIVSLAMIFGLLLLVLGQGLRTFWPGPVLLLTIRDPLASVETPILGEVARAEAPEPGPAAAAPDSGTPPSDHPASALAAKDSTTIAATGRLLRIGNFELTNAHFQWVPDAQVVSASRPAWALVVERLTWGRFYGFPQGFLVDGQRVADSAPTAWEAFDRYHPGGRAARSLPPGRFQLELRTAAGHEVLLPLEQIVRAYPANALSVGQRWRLYGSRWWEFLSTEPREANSEGGVFPAIFGTVTMTLLMSLAVVPFGVLAALYLKEYASRGWIVTLVRIAVNNLAGVPSIVFGVFGLGFFCYGVGGQIDRLFFADRLPAQPTFGTGGVLWAALTLALLTLPVVIVAAEEAFSAVPNSLREGSYACGASKWQTIWRIVLPRALPGIMTGMILAMARGAGEVAPLMLVGAIKLAPTLPVDGTFPYLHLQRSFMHLGFHIYDVGFQSQNSEAARPLVFTTTLLLIAVITFLNLSAVWIRGRLRRRFLSGQF